MSATADRFAHFHSTFTGMPSADAFRARKSERPTALRDIAMIGLVSSLTLLLCVWGYSDGGHASAQECASGLYAATADVPRFAD